MKLRFFINFALVFAGSFLIAICLFSCKKNLATSQLPDTVIVESDDIDPVVKDFVRKIKHFETLLVRCKTEKVDCTMQIDSALWNVEALLNATYTFPEKYYDETVKQDLQFSVDINENGCLAMNDLACLYDEITASVRDAYANDGIETDKSLMTVIINKDDVINDNKVLFDVTVISGRTNNNSGNNFVEGGPFTNTDCWYYGELGGTCDDPSVISDAAEEIEDWINFLYARTLVPIIGHRYINCNLITVRLDGSEFVRNNGISYIFNSQYAPENQSLYFGTEDLNFYFNGEKKVILKYQPEKMVEEGHVTDNFSFIQVDIKGLYEDGVAFHQNIITYGNRMLVPETEIGPAIDMLK